MATNLDNTTFVGNFDDNTTEYYTEFDNPEIVEEATSKNARWKEMSIGGTFGLLLAGGGLYASGVLDNDSTDALMAGAKAADKADIDFQEADSTSNDPVLLDENGNPVPVPGNRNPDPTAPITEPDTHAADVEVYHQVIRRQTTPAHKSMEDENHVTDKMETHVTHNDNHTTSNHNATAHVAHATQHVPGTEDLNMMDIMQSDDSMSFSQAFAAARAEMGPGAAFCWRGGVYGTYYKEEWQAMTHQQKAEFTEMAVSEAADMYSQERHHLASNNNHKVDDDEMIHTTKTENDDHHQTNVHETDDVDTDGNDIELIKPDNSDYGEYYPQIVEIDGQQVDLLEDTGDIVSLEDVSASEDILEMISANINNDIPELFTDETGAEVYDYVEPDIVDTTDDYMPDDNALDIV